MTSKFITETSIIYKVDLQCNISSKGANSVDLDLATAFRPTYLPKSELLNKKQYL